VWIIFQNFVAISVVIATGLLACEAALGDYCKWTDENGVVHYAEECPENTETELVEIQPSLAQDRVQEAQRRSEALLSSRETSGQERAEGLERQTARSTQADHKQGKRERCFDAMVDLHNLREGEAMYFDERGKLHDQFSIHSSSYSGERTYISDLEHKAFIEAKQSIVLTDCVQSQDETIARIKMLAARSDSQMCKNLYERVLKDKRYDRSADTAELQSIEKTVLEVCN
jgi:hypothetical protein